MSEQLMQKPFALGMCRAALETAELDLADLENEIAANGPTQTLSAALQAAQARVLEASIALGRARADHDLELEKLEEAETEDVARRNALRFG